VSDLCQNPHPSLAPLTGGEALQGNEDQGLAPAGVTELWW
jgi:hypothetical protein